MEILTDINQNATVITGEAATHTQAGETAKSVSSGEPLPINSNVENTTGSVPLPPPSVLTEVLLSYGLKATAQNVEILNLLLDNEITLSKENFIRMNQALRLTDSTEKALFLFLNGIKLTQANASQLDGLLDGRIRINELINNIMEALQDINDPAVKGQLMRIFSGLANMENLPLTEGQPHIGQLQQQVQTGQAQTMPQQEGPLVLNQQLNMPSPVSGGVLQQGLPVDSQALAADNTQQAPNNQILANTEAGQQTGAAANAVTTGLGQPAQAVNDAGAPIPGTTNTENMVASTTQNTLQNPTESPTQGLDTRPANDSTNVGTPIITNENATSIAGNTAPPVLAEETMAGAAGAQNIASNSMASPNAAKQASGQMRLRLPISVIKDSPEEIDKFLNNLRDAVREAARVLGEAGRDTPEAARLTRYIQALSEHIDFVSQMKHQVYVQLPLADGTGEDIMALHVYKDGKGENHKKTTARSALIAIETANLGYFETYVTKNAASVICQFRLNNKIIEQLVGANIHKLEALFKEKNLSLDSISFLPPGKQFTLLDNPDTIEGTETHREDKTFGFDRRV